MRLVWRATARDDRRRITAWLAERNPAAAVRITRALLAAADGLAVLPEKGRPVWYLAHANCRPYRLTSSFTG